MAQSVNDYLFRLALVINTSHSKFNDNLASIIIYILYMNRDIQPSMSIDGLEQGIREYLGLEFTTKEILQSIKADSNLFIETSDKKISLSEVGAHKIHASRPTEIKNIFQRYKEEYGIELSIDELADLLYGFLYNSLGQNITDLLTVVEATASEDISKINTDGYSNDQKRIINDFLDWDNSEKNDLLYQLISFSVDYCRLTVRKDSNSFKTLLQGKIFYLDANIIFRMMGLNNVRRQEVVVRFIEKCKESGIKLCYTTLTRQEVLDSIHYHVSSVQKALQNYRGRGIALNRLYNKYSSHDGFMEAYISWCGKTDGYGKFDEFEKSLKSDFYRCVNGMTLEDVIGITAPQKEVDGYFNAKNGNTSVETAECDIKNVHYILKQRGRSGSAIGWNTKEYLISADHKLIDWASETFSSINPVVVLPSVWYSAILKISGRSTSDDEKSFVEFIKLRYMQDTAEENIKFLISEVCNKTSDGILQDMLFTEISDNNELINRISVSRHDDVPRIVEKTYDNVLEKTKKEVFSAGRESGLQEGKNLGYAEGNEKGIASGREVGEKIGRLKQKRSEIEIAATNRAISTQKRNIKIVIVFSILVFIALIVCAKKIGITFFEEYKDILGIIISVVITGPIGFLFTRVFSLDLEKLKNEEHIKIEAQLQEIDTELSLLERK